MAINFERIKAGDVLWDYHSYGMGNTTMRAMGNWSVRVIEINHDAGWAIVSWNGNQPEKWYRHKMCRLRRSKGKETSRW